MPSTKNTNWNGRDLARARRFGTRYAESSCDSLRRLLNDTSRTTIPKPDEQPRPDWSDADWDQYLTRNLRFVIWMAKRYRGPVELIDAFQAGCLGLIRARQLYRFDRDANFITYAHYWVRSTILQERTQRHRLIRYPSYIEERIYEVEKLRRTFRRRYHRDLSTDELSVQLGLPDKQAGQLLDLLDQQFIELDGQEWYDWETRSVETSWSLLAGNRLTDPSFQAAATFAQEVMLAELVFWWNTAVQHHPMVGLIFAWRYGLDRSCQMRKLEEVGELVHRQRERVRQILDQLQRLMWHPTRYNRSQALWQAVADTIGAGLTVDSWGFVQRWQKFETTVETLERLSLQPLDLAAAWQSSIDPALLEIVMHRQPVPQFKKHRSVNDPALKRLRRVSELLDSVLGVLKQKTVTERRIWLLHNGLVQPVWKIAGVKEIGATLKLPSTHVGRVIDSVWTDVWKLPGHQELTRRELREHLETIKASNELQAALAELYIQP